MATSPDVQIEDPVFDEYRPSGDTNTTPNSEFSPPDSPASKNAALAQADDARSNSRRLAASLTLEEQVGIMVSVIIGILTS